MTAGNQCSLQYHLNKLETNYLTEGEADVIDGIEIVKKDLISIFKKNGIDPINCINEKFDPNFHQAMLEIENSNKEPGTVVQEIQKGYMMKNRLLRPSLVGVAKKKEERTNKTTKDDEKIEKKDQKK